MHCSFCKAGKPEWITREYQISIEFDRGIYFSYGCYGLYGIGDKLLSKQLIYGESMTEQEELFAKFYNHEKVLVKDMDVIALREHRAELEKIAFEAKARLVAADDEHRERKAKTSNKEWLVSDQRPDYDVSSAINVVKKRSERMSKMDRLEKELKKIGMDDSIVKEMVTNLERKATDKQLKTVTFSKQAKEISAVQVRIEPEKKEPFDPSSLFKK